MLKLDPHDNAER